MDLGGLADLWEQSVVVRTRLREEQRLLSVDSATLKCTVANVALHMEVFAPVLEMTTGEKPNLHEAAFLCLSFFLCRALFCSSP